MRGRTCSATRHQEAAAPVCAWVVVIACTRLRGPLTATSNRPVDAGHEQDPARWLSWCCPSVSFMLPLPATTPARYVSPPMRNAHGYHSNTAAIHHTGPMCVHCGARNTARRRARRRALLRRRPAASSHSSSCAEKDAHGSVVFGPSSADGTPTPAGSIRGLHAGHVLASGIEVLVRHTQRTDDRDGQRHGCSCDHPDRGRKWDTRKVDTPLALLAGRSWELSPYYDAW